MFKNNAVFRTYLRLMIRQSGWIYTLIGGLISLAVIVALYVGRLFESLTKLMDVASDSPWVLGLVGKIQIIAILFLILKPVIDRLHEEMRDGQFVQNRMSPMTPVQLFWGYAFGPSLPGLLLVAVCALLTLFSIPVTAVTFTMWLNYQLVIVMSSLLAMAFGVFVGLIPTDRKRLGIVMLVAVFILGLLGKAYETRGAFGLLVPFHALELIVEAPTVKTFELYGWAISPLLGVFLLQLSVFVFSTWAALRRLRDPLRPFATRPMVLLILVFYVAVQNALAWTHEFRNFKMIDSLVLIVFIGIISLVAVVPAMIDVYRHRVAHPREGRGAFVLRSSPLWMIPVGSIACALFVPFLSNTDVDLSYRVISVLATMVGLVIIATLAELLRFRNTTRVRSMWALIFFAATCVPLIVAAFAGNGHIATLALFGPAIGALVELEESATNLWLALVFQSIVMVVLLAIWWRMLKGLLRVAERYE